ncbi:CDC9 ATP-dependent DNA ligase [uncultured Caudovirales phage]|uniref:DNA ligase n=1 Tax=uncultured Caudovirales phage TaxID=2100421 RepID=A0A6J5MBA0_9CAUD|nr:CDC9 ATP-dependent DNA ligase [uncultured Caudovirales phage]
MILGTIYKRTESGKTQEWTIEVKGNQYRTISGQTDGKKVVSEWTTVYGKNAGKINETTDAEQAMKEAEAKRKLKLERGYFETLSDIDETQYFKPMLAKDWNDEKHRVKFPLYSQPKLDGIRCIVKKDGMWTRNGKPILSAPHIYEGLKPLFKANPELIFDGELYCDKLANDFNKIVSLVKKSKPTADDLKESAEVIEYHIYDLPSVNDIFTTRYGVNLCALHLPKCCVIVPTHTVKNEDEVMERYGRYVERGYEGQILRVNEKYENKRSKYLLKHKSFQDAEYEILDVVEGEGNRSGTCGYMIFQTEDGQQFKSNVKGTLEETAQMLKDRKKLIGKSATIKYFNLTPAGIPRFPYVVNIGREDYE